jgi:hypothetical protein
MKEILKYYEDGLGEDQCDTKLFFEVEGDKPHSFSELRKKLETNGNPFCFNPDPLIDKDTRERRGHFTLWQIEKVPDRRLIPGIVFDNAGVKQLLVHHSWTDSPETTKTFRDHLHYKLRHLGCGPIQTTLIHSSSATRREPVWEESSLSEHSTLHKKYGTTKEELAIKYLNYRFFEELEKIQPDEYDKDAIINPKTRFLGKGGSFLIVAPSGVGKSTLLMQIAICWSAGRDFFGLKPVRPLRCFLLQGENDDGDVVEMAKGIKAGLKLSKPEYNALTKNFTMQSMFGTGKLTDFSELFQDLVEIHQPDVFFLDPLFAFVHGDFSKQEEMSRQFRQGINRVLKSSGCVFVSTHHTPKPAKETPRTGGTDFSYSGFGTSELTNWYRAVATLRPEKGKPKVFRFIVAKRGARTGFPDGLNYCLMRHSENKLYWDEVPKIVMRTLEGPLNREEYDLLKLFVKIRDEGHGTVAEIIGRITKAKNVLDRQAGNYWAKLKKYFVEDGKQWRPKTPQEFQELKMTETSLSEHPDLVEQLGLGQSKGHPKKSKSGKAPVRKINRAENRGPSRRKKSSRKK